MLHQRASLNAYGNTAPYAILKQTVLWGQ